MIRLQKVIAESGYCSRRKAEEYILEGNVQVNGKVVTELGTKVNENDEIMIFHKLIQAKEAKEYYLFYKPEGVISSVHDEKNRRTVVSFIETKARIYPVGRLDYDTTGLILLTNDGELSNLLMHPRNKIEKKYLAKVKGNVTVEEMVKLKKGILIDGRKVVPTTVKIKRKSANYTTVLIGITEGRNHIVKKIMSSIQHDVLKLKRVSYAFLDLEGLKVGEYRKLTIKEVKRLYALK